MSKNELTKKYELVMIVNAKLTGDAKEAIRKDVTNVVNKHGGKVINSQVWLEKHKLTFAIKKCGEGTYYIINFESATDAVAKMDTDLKLNEKILRYAFIKAEPKAESKVAPEAVQV